MQKTCTKSSMENIFTFLVVLISSIFVTDARVLNRCEFAYEILDMFTSPGTDGFDNINAWACIAETSTGLNTSYFDNSSGIITYGILKISSFWCDDGTGGSNLCHLRCEELLHNDLSATIACARLIFDLNGGTFSYWQPVWNDICGFSTTDYLNDCSRFVIHAENAVEILEGTSTTILCRVRGYPPPNVWWEWGTQKESDARVEAVNGTMEGIFYTARIILMNVQVSDAKTYTCVSTNGRSMDRKYVDVVVLRAASTTTETLITETTAENTTNYGASDTTTEYTTLYTTTEITKPSETTDFTTNPTTKSDASIPWKAVMWVGSLLVFLGLLATPLGISICKDRKKDIRTGFESVSHGHMRYAHANKDVESLMQSMQLGSGAFGVVYQGTLDDQVTVAVKTVHRRASQKSLQALISEVKIMKYVGYHPNIVQLLGVQVDCLRKEKFYAVMEFCSMGSLESVLKNDSGSFIPALRYSGKSNGSNYVKGYLSSRPLAVPFSKLCLLRFSYQVSTAMEFLETKQIIHGDLATRNVLVDAQWTAKISDFGLSSRIYDTYKSYARTNKGTLLPWRWLSIEALVELRFSTASDVWAFGVFMWEVFSLAELPYSAEARFGPRFVTRLMQGFRLSQPAYANSNIYKIMQRCWEAEASDRISFTELSSTLLAFVEVEELRQQFHYAL